MRWWLIPILLLFTALVARSLDADPLWIDELYSVGNVGAVYRVPFTPAEVWQSVQENSPQHTPGYFFLLSGWVSLTGWTPFAMRALSLLLGVLSVAWMYRIGHDWFSPRVGLYAAVVMAVSAFFIHFAHEIRMYTLILLLTLTTLWLYRRLVSPPRHSMERVQRGSAPSRLKAASLPPRKGGEVWLYPALFLSALSLLYTHIIGAIPLAAIGLYHLLLAPKNKRWLGVTGAFGLAGLLFLPWVPVLLSEASYGSREDISLDPAGIIQATLHWFSNGYIVLLVGLILGVIVLWISPHPKSLSLRARDFRGVFLPFALREKGAGVEGQRAICDVAFFAIAMLILTIVMNEITAIVTPNRPRYLIPVWPVLTLLVAFGLAFIMRRSRIVGLVALVIWLALGVYSTFDPAFLLTMDGPRHVVEFPPLKKIVNEVNRLAEPEDMLVTFSQHQHVFERFKFVSIGEFHFHDLKVDSYRITLPEIRPPEQVREEMRSAVGKRLTVWFAYEPEIAPPELELYRDVLAENYTQCATALDDADLRIERYDYAPFACLDQPTDAPALTFAEGITLQDVRWQVDESVLRVAAGWNIADSVPPNTYSVSLKLWPDDSSFVAQFDYGLRSNGFGWQMAELPLADVPAGDYHLTATVYDWRLGPRLLATDAAGAQGEELTVAQITLPNGNPHE